MRRMLSLAVAGVAVAATVAPLQPASAFCWETYYEVTGTCSPCSQVNYVLVTAGQEPLICFA